MPVAINKRQSPIPVIYAKRSFGCFGVGLRVRFELAVADALGPTPYFLLMRESALAMVDTDMLETSLPFSFREKDRIERSFGFRAFRDDLRRSRYEPILALPDRAGDPCLRLKLWPMNAGRHLLRGAYAKNLG